MKITSLRCTSCGASLTVEKEGQVTCSYCGHNFYAELEKAPMEINTTINNYNTGESHTANDKPKNNPLILIAIAMLFASSIMIFNFVNKESNDDIIVNTTLNVFDSHIADADIIDYTISSSVEDLEDLRSLVNLKNLEILDASLLKDYSMLYNMSRLEDIRINGAEHLEEAGFFASYPAIRLIHIEGSKLTDLSVLSGKLSITDISLINNTDLMDYSFLSSLKSLKNIEIEAAEGANIPDLSELEFIESLVINGEVIR